MSDDRLGVERQDLASTRRRAPGVGDVGEQRLVKLDAVARIAVIVGHRGPHAAGSAAVVAREQFGIGRIHRGRDGGNGRNLSSPGVRMVRRSSRIALAMLIRLAAMRISHGTPSVLPTSWGSCDQALSCSGVMAAIWPAMLSWLMRGQSDRSRPPPAEQRVGLRPAGRRRTPRRSRPRRRRRPRRARRAPPSEREFGRARHRHRRTAAHRRCRSAGASAGVRRRRDRPVVGDRAASAGLPDGRAPLPGCTDAAAPLPAAAAAATRHRAASAGGRGRPGPGPRRGRARPSSSIVSASACSRPRRRPIRRPVPQRLRSPARAGLRVGTAHDRRDGGRSPVPPCSNAAAGSRAVRAQCVNTSMQYVEKLGRSGSGAGPRVRSRAGRGG